MEIRWTRSATRHRINRHRSGYVAQTAEVILRQPAPDDSRATDERIVFLGPDEDGIDLEVMAIETELGLLIIHAMPIRATYRPYLEEENDS